MVVVAVDVCDPSLARKRDFHGVLVWSIVVTCNCLNSLPRLVRDKSRLLPFTKLFCVSYGRMNEVDKPNERTATQHVVVLRKKMTCR